MKRRTRKEDPYTLRAIMRQVYRRSPREVNDPLADRARLAGRIALHAQDGEVLLVVRQMDCDCAEWTSASVLPASVLVVQRAIDATYDNAEGRVSWWLASPDEHIERDERDHALEAYEEGHPHVVYA